MSTDFTSDALYLGNIVNYSIQLVFIGSPTGTFKLQCSNDPGSPSSPGRAPQSNTVVNWTDVTDSTQGVSAAGNHVWNVENCGYVWVRVVYTAAYGNGLLLVARASVKGV